MYRAVFLYLRYKWNFHFLWRINGIMLLRIPPAAALPVHRHHRASYGSVPSNHRFRRPGWHVPLSYPHLRHTFLYPTLRQEMRRIPIFLKESCIIVSPVLLSGKIPCFLQTRTQVQLKEKARQGFGFQLTIVAPRTGR